MDKVFILLISISLIACSSEEPKNKEETQENKQTETPQGNKVSRSVSRAEILPIKKAILGTWQFVSKEEDESPLSKVKQSFTPEGNWFISQEVKSDTSLNSIAGGNWVYDEITNQLTTLTLPDSSLITYNISDLKGNLLILKTASGSLLEWEKVNEPIELPSK